MEELMEPIIQIKNVTKTFIGKDNQVEALKGISLDINKGGRWPGTDHAVRIRVDQSSSPDWYDFPAF